jgi:phage-related baseplate assembly protein
MGNNGMTKHAYASWALSVTGVVAATVLDQHPRGQGTVDVIVKGADGIPTDNLLAAVRTAVATGAMPEDVQAGPPVNDDWQVRAPQAVPLAITGTLILVPGTHAASARAEAEERIRALFTDPSTVPGISPLQIGEDVPRDRLTAAVMAVSGVKRVEWTSPASDVTVPEDGLATLEALTLDTSEAEEE